MIIYASILQQYFLGLKRFMSITLHYYSYHLCEVQYHYVQDIYSKNNINPLLQRVSRDNYPNSRYEVLSSRKSICKGQAYFIFRSPRFLKLRNFRVSFVDKCFAMLGTVSYIQYIHLKLT